MAERVRKASAIIPELTNISPGTTNVTPALPTALNSHVEHSAWTLWHLRALQPSKLQQKFLWILWFCCFVNHPLISFLKTLYLPIKFSSSNSSLVTEVTAERRSLHLDPCTPPLLTPWSLIKAVGGIHHIWECFIQAITQWKPERKKDWFVSQIHTRTDTDISAIWASQLQIQDLRQPGILTCEFLTKNLLKIGVKFKSTARGASHP